MKNRDKILDYFDNVADGKEEEKPEKEESDDDTEETETINLEEV